MDFFTLNSMAADSLRAVIAMRSAFSFSVIGSEPASIHNAIDSKQKRLSLILLKIRLT